MSVKVQGWVWDQPIPTSPKIVLLKLADHADHEGGNIYPSVASIAIQTGLSERQVQRYLRSFVDCGILVIDDHRKGGRGMPRTYRFTFQKGDAYVTHSSTVKGDAHDTVSNTKRVTPVTGKGDMEGTKRVTPEVVSGEDTLYEPSEEPSGTVSSPDDDRSSQPFDLLEAMLDVIGQDVSVLTQREKGKQLAVAKRLLSDGMTVQDVRGIVLWLMSQTWITSGIDFFAIERYLGRWQMAGKPSQAGASLTVHYGGRDATEEEFARWRRERNGGVAPADVDDVIETAGRIAR